MNACSGGAVCLESHPTGVDRARPADDVTAAGNTLALGVLCPRERLAGGLTQSPFMSMEATYVRLSPAALQAALTDLDTGLEQTVELFAAGAAFDGLRYLLNAAGSPVDLPWDGAAVLDAETASEEDFESFPYGPPVYLTPEQVGRVAAFAEQWPFDRLRPYFQPAEMLAATVYPGIWADDPDAEAYLAEHYEPLRVFLSGAARAGDALIAWVS